MFVESGKYNVLMKERRGASHGRSFLLVEDEATYSFKMERRQYEKRGGLCGAVTADYLSGNGDCLRQGRTKQGCPAETGQAMRPAEFRYQF